MAKKHKGKGVNPDGSRNVEHIGEGDQPVGFTEKSTLPFIEQRERYYQKWLGPCLTVYHEMQPILPHVDVYLHGPSKKMKRPFYTLVTGGMSDLRMNTPPGVPRRAELIGYLTAPPDPDDPEPLEVYLMRHLATFPARHDTWFGHGHTVPNGNYQPFTTDCELTGSLLVVPTFFEDEEFLNGLTIDGDEVIFLWQVLLTTDELEYKLRHGLEDLFALFSIKQFPPYFDFDRKSIV